MNDFPISVVATVVASTAILVGLLSLLVFIYERRRAARYNHERQRAELEMMRRSTETKLYELNERLVATEARWRDANHLLLDSQGYQKPDARSETRLSDFLRNAGLSMSDLQEDRKMVFVLTPFHPEFRPTFETIRNVCADLGLRAVRGDEEFVPADLMSHILRLLVRARLVIAVIDGRNPNVFYELGIAHALNKPTVLVSSQADIDLPFDITSRRVLMAGNQADLANLLRAEITRSVVQAD